MATCSQFESEPTDQKEEKTNDLLVISNEIFKNNKPFMNFYTFLAEHRNNPDLLRMRTKSGLSLLHQCIYNKRSDLLIAFIYTLLWGELVHLEVEDTSSPFYGYDVFDIAEKIADGFMQQEVKRLAKFNTLLLREPLMTACLEGNCKKFKQLIEQSPKKIILKTIEGTSFLDLAIASGCVEMIEVVWQAEQKAKFKRLQVDDQLRLCVELGHGEMITKLHSKIKLNVNVASGSAGKTLVERSVMLGDIKTFEVLIKLGASLPPAALSLAAAKGDVDFVKGYLARFRNDLSLLHEDRRGKNAIQFAIEKGYPQIVALLLREVIDLHHTDKQGKNIIHCSAENGNLQTLNYLLQRFQGRVDLQELLHQQDKHLGNELCLLVRGKSEDHNAWHYVVVDRALLHTFKEALRSGYVNVVDYGVVLKSGWGNDPPQEIIDEISAKFDIVNLRDDAPKDMTPLHRAILKSQVPVALCLIDKMTDVNTVDHFKLTPLHLACMTGNTEIIKALVEKGARWDAVDEKGRTPLKVAELNGHDDISNYAKTTPLQYATQTFITRRVSRISEKLSKVELERQLETGGSIENYIREQLRDLTGYVDQFLYDIVDAGPITSETADRFGQ